MQIENAAILDSRSVERMSVAGLKLLLIAWQKKILGNHPVPQPGACPI